jgi:hypothetical protein
MRRNKHKNTPICFQFRRLVTANRFWESPNIIAFGELNNSCLVRGLVTVTATPPRYLSVRLLAVEHGAIQLQWRLPLTAVQFE